MYLELKTGYHVNDRAQDRIARVLYLETGATSLRAVEALASMIANSARRHSCSALDVIDDSEMFSVPNKQIPVSSPGFQMCRRVATRMLRGVLQDSCWGATRFHHSDQMPDWAIARGYIADIDGLLFYL